MGILAARINTCAVWRLDFFDDHSVRVDLIDEVVRLYIEKATAIERAVGALYERSDALAAVFLDSLAPLSATLASRH